MAVVKDGEVKTFLDAFSYFGEGALNKEEVTVRSATVRAISDVECLSIGKTSFLNIFGNSMSELVQRNVLRNMFRSSQLLKHLNLVQMEKCINRMQTKVYPDKTVLIEKDEQVKEIFFVFDKAKWNTKSSFNLESTKAFGDDYLYENSPFEESTEISAVYNDSLATAGPKCKVSQLSFKDFFEVIGRFVS